MKRFFSTFLLLLAVLAFSLVSCNKKSSSASNSTSGVKTYKIGVAIYSFEDAFMNIYKGELVRLFKEKETANVKYELEMVDGKNDMSTQSNQIDTFITQKVDAVVLNLVQTSSAEQILKRLNNAKIPCVIINREPLAETFKDFKNICYVGSDAKQSGIMQGNIVLGLPNKGDINGDGKISYVMIEGDPENSDAQYRTEYSIKTIKDAGVAVECLVDQVGNWQRAQGQQICANALAQFGKEIEVVFCNNDDMAIGAEAAISAAGRKINSDIYLLGVDALDEAKDLIKKGRMTGTVLNDITGQADKAAEVVSEVLKGKSIEKYYWIDYRMITNK